MQIDSLAPDVPDDGTVPLLQSAAAGRALGALRLRVTESGIPVAQALLLRRFGLAATIQGPLWHPAATPGQCAAALRALRRAGLRLVDAPDPATATALRAAGFRQIATPAHVARLDLLPDTDARRHALDGKWRNRLVLAESSGLTLHHRRLRGANDPLLLAAADLARRRRYRSLPPAFAAACAAAAPGSMVVEARLRGLPVAAMLILRHGCAATYQVGHTTAAGRAAEAHRLILWHVINHLAGNGVTRLDLGTIDTETAPGLARFKLGTGARAVPLGGSYLAIPGL